VKDELIVEKMLRVLHVKPNHQLVRTLLLQLVQEQELIVKQMLRVMDANPNVQAFLLTNVME